jgi:hypothetical protein
MSIKILIDRIVLEVGHLSAGQRRRLQAEIEAELTYLLTTHGMPYCLRYEKTVSNLSVYVDNGLSDMNSAKLGKNIAHSIYRELKVVVSK